MTIFGRTSSANFGRVRRAVTEARSIVINDSSYLVMRSPQGTQENLVLFEVGHVRLAKTRSRDSVKHVHYSSCVTAKGITRDSGLVLCVVKVVFLATIITG